MASAAPLMTASLSPVTVAGSQRATAPDFDRLDGGREQSFSFSDFLSVINPLQHIPIVGTIYRAITGDTINPAAKVMGGMLFGGPMGLITSAFSAVVEQVTGKDFGDQALALVMPGGDEAPGTPQYAAAEAAAPSPAAAKAADEDAPLSRALLDAGPAVDMNTALAGNTPIVPQASRARALGHARAHVAGNSGRSLADYWATAGRPMPVIDSTRSASNATPVKLQTTAPVSERARALPAAAGAADTQASPPPATPDAATQAGGEAPTDPFVAAMMRGLDRYREMKQAQTRAAPTVIDASL